MSEREPSSPDDEAENLNPKLDEEEAGEFDLTHENELLKKRDAEKQNKPKS